MSVNVSRRTGFTLIELLVVVAIIGILVSLLLPAVQAAREAARRLKCKNNLKQLSMGVIQYETRWRRFPPASHWNSGSNINASDNANLSETWVVMVLPFIEQQPLYDSFDRTQPITAQANEFARSIELEVMFCPTDTNNRVKYSGNSSHGDNWARGNYGANAAMGYQSDSKHCDDANLDGAGCAAYATSLGWNDSRIRGVMGANASVSSTEIRDGTTSTMMLAELRAGVTNFDVRGTWAFPGAGASALWAHGWVGEDATGPNSRGKAISAMEWVGGDDVDGCQQTQDVVGGDTALRDQGMPCDPNAEGANIQATARSMHVGGINVARCDGSVRFIHDHIDSSTTIEGSTIGFSVWDKFCLSMDGSGEVPEDALE